MKRYQIGWTYTKHHSTRIATALFLAGTLLLPRTTAAEELAALANVTSEAGREVSVGTLAKQTTLAMVGYVRPTTAPIGTPSTTTPASNVQLFLDLPLSGLQAPAFATTNLPNHTSSYFNQQAPSLTASDDTSWVMFAW